MNRETICNPVQGADVEGFNFFRDQNGIIIFFFFFFFFVRCCWCVIGLTSRPKTLRQSGQMIMHLELVHGLREGR